MTNVPDFQSFLQKVTTGASSVSLPDSMKYLLSTVGFTQKLSGDNYKNDLRMIIAAPCDETDHRKRAFDLWDTFVEELFQTIELRALEFPNSTTRCFIDAEYIDAIKSRLLMCVKALVLDDPALDPALCEVIPFSRLLNQARLIELTYGISAGDYKEACLVCFFTVQLLHLRPDGSAMLEKNIFSSWEAKVGFQDPN